MEKNYEAAVELAAHVLPYLTEVSKSSSEEDIKSDMTEIRSALENLASIAYDMDNEI